MTSAIKNVAVLCGQGEQVVGVFTGEQVWYGRCCTHLSVQGLICAVCFKTEF